MGQSHSSPFFVSFHLPLSNVETLLSPEVLLIFGKRTLYKSRGYIQFYKEVTEYGN